MKKIRVNWKVFINTISRANKSKKSSLKWLAGEAEKAQCDAKKASAIQRIMNDSYYPSLKSFFTLLPFPLLFYFVARSRELFPKFGYGSVQIWGTNPLDRVGNGYSNLIAIHAGIGIIIFALVIFIAESLRDDDSKDRARVLLKESFLFPLAVVEILTFFTLIWGEANFWSVIPVLIIGLLTVLSLSKIILVLINKVTYAKKRSELLRDRLARSFGVAIRERLANNILISRLEKSDIKLKFNPYSGRESNEFYDLPAWKLGIIVDIDLHVLAKIGDYIEAQANRNDYAFGSDKRPDMGATFETDLIEIEKVRKGLRLNTNRFLIKKFHDVVSAESRTLLRIEKCLIEGAEDIEVLHSLVKSAFTIERRDNFSEEMRIEISSVRDELLTAISSGRLGAVKELTGLYKNLGEVSLDLITQCGGGYSSEEARAERFSLFSGWEQVKWLSSDIYDFYRVAVRSGDTEIVRDVTYLPVSIAIKAIEKDDHYLFQEFIDFAKYSYGLAIREKAPEVREVLVDRSWRYLKEMSMIYLDTQLRSKSLQAERAASLKDFAVYLFVVFQDLLKQSFDSRDIASFRVFLREARKLFDALELESQLSTSRHWRHRLRMEGLPDAEARDITALLESRDLREKIQDEIESAREQMFFGLTSWILDRYVEDPQNQVVRECYQLLQVTLPDNIEDFTALFLLVHNYEVESLWGWDRWEMTENEGTYTIRILEKIERFYAVRSLSYLVNETATSIGRITLPFDRELGSLVKGNRDLLRFLEEFKTQPDKWKFVLTDPMLSSVDLFLELLQKAEKMQEAKESQKLRSQAISPERIREFKSGFIRGFDETNTMRTLFSYFGRFMNDESMLSDDDERRFGINTVADKGAFVDESPVIYYEWGRDYGRNFAHSEDAFLIEHLSSECVDLGVTEELFSDILMRAGSLDDLLIVGTNVGFWDYFQGDDRFHARWELDRDFLELQNLDGGLEINGVQIPIFELHNPKFVTQILILKKSKLGFFCAASPLNAGEEPTKVENGFYMDVSAFSSDEALMNKFLQSPPEWLRSKGDVDEQRLYLETRVRLQLFERITFDSKDFEGFRIGVLKQF